MIDENQKIEVQWFPSNRKHYENLGYVFTKNKDKFLIPVKDLPLGSHMKVTVKCDYCSNNRTVIYKNYMKSKRNNKKYACDKCKLLKKAESTLHNRQELLFNKALGQAQLMSYSILTDKEDIKRNTSYIEYLCPKHGAHKMRVSNFIIGKRCPDCQRENANLLFKNNKDKIIKEVKKFGGELLNAEEYINNTTNNLKILCPKCKKEFITSFRNFTQHRGQLCKTCSAKSESIGEFTIRKYLEINSIYFIQEYKFPNCKDSKPLPFDFYLPDYNICIEFDGRQHYSETNYFSYSYNKVKQHDKIKNQYCFDNNIYLIRIPYWKIDKIKNILDQELIIHSHKDIV